MDGRWRLLTRLAAVLVVAVAARQAWSLFGARLVKAYEVWRYPPITSVSPLGADLQAQVNGQRRAQLVGEYKRVMTLLNAASAQGFDVSALEGRLPAAARMVQDGEYEYAATLLSSIEARIPQRREGFGSPASDDAGTDEAPPPPAPRPAPRAGRRRPVRRSRRRP